MQGLVIVHERDMARLQGMVLDKDPLSRDIPSPDIFDIDNCTFELCLFSKTRDGQVQLRDADGLPFSQEEISQRFSTIILAAGEHAVSNPDVRNILSVFLHGRDSPAWSNEAVIVLRLARDESSPLRTLPDRRVFFTPSHDPRDQPAEGADWVNQVRSELIRLIKMIDENQTRNPNVGFGLLLVDRQFRFFLMERLKEPAKGTIGTIGGNFERGHAIVAELDTVLKRRFRSDTVPQIDLGPLLSCSNMKSEFLHYIDLTFLAIVKGGSLHDVFDDELRPVGPEARRCLQRGATPRPPTHDNMFSLTDVAIFHREGLLFAPVANAFESLCRGIFADQLRYGRRRKIYVPSLVDEDRSLELQLPGSPDSIREIVSSVTWSKSAMPFFEGDIS